MQTMTFTYTWVVFKSTAFYETHLNQASKLQIHVVPSK